MSIHIARYCAVALAASALAGCIAPSTPSSTPQAAVSQYGVVAVKSAYPFADTISRLKQDIAAKGLMFFDEIDQAKLAADAGITAMPSTLLVFGNPALGTQFITANQQAGIDWPVRLLVYQDREGQVWAEYTDFGYIAKRHAIVDRDPQFQKASEVIASIAASVAVK